MITLAERSSHPANPASGYRRAYIGPDGRVYTRNSAGLLVKLDHSGLGMGKFLHKYTGGSYTNNWIFPNRIGSSSFNTLPMTHQRLYAMPWPIQTTVTVAEMGVYVTGAGSGTGLVAHLLIYYGVDEDDEGPLRGLDIYPGKLLLNAGTVDASTTGEKKITGLATQLEEGRLYFGAILIDCSTPPTFSSMVDSTLMPVISCDSAWSGSKTGFYNSSVATVPDPYPVFSSYQSGTTPSLGFRRSA